MIKPIDNSAKLYIILSFVFSHKKRRRKAKDRVPCFPVPLCGNEKRVRIFLRPLPRPTPSFSATPHHFPKTMKPTAPHPRHHTTAGQEIALHWRPSCRRIAAVNPQTVGITAIAYNSALNTLTFCSFSAAASSGDCTRRRLPTPHRTANQCQPATPYARAFFNPLPCKYYLFPVIL